MSENFSSPNTWIVATIGADEAPIGNTFAAAAPLFEQTEVKDQSEVKTEAISDIRDDMFNFELVYFRVENTVFTVIKEWLMVEDSPFPAMFSLPQAMSSSTGVEGLTRENPIVLENTSATSFKALLRALYSSRCGRLRAYNELVGALELSLRWNFNEIRADNFRALKEILHQMRPAARITAARKFSLGHWLRIGLIDLSKEVSKKRLSPTALADDPEFPLDMATVANVFFVCMELDQEVRLAHEEESEGCWSCLPPLIWGIKARPGSCFKCRTREEIVVRIFGPEIEGCIYDKEF